MTIANLVYRPSYGCPAAMGHEPSVMLDPFAGTGTIGVVAQKLGRQAVLMELSPLYCELAKARVEVVPLPLAMSHA